MNLPSPDITVFEFGVLYDLSQVSPVITLTNQSVGPNLAGCTWVFQVFSSSNIPIYTSSTTSPALTGNWTTWTIPGTFPQPYNQIEFSTSPFRIVAIVIDSHATQYTYLPEKDVVLVAPNGNSGESNTNFGVANMEIVTSCSTAQLNLIDNTNYVYNGVAGTQLSKLFTVVYPTDANGNTPAPFQSSVANNVLAPILYNANGYQAALTAVMSYNFGNNITVYVKYSVKYVFNVLCNISLCDIIAKYQALGQELTTCNELEAANKREQYAVLTSLIVQLEAAILQPLCGIDTDLLINQIQDLIGQPLNCGCSSGVTPIISSVQAGSPTCITILSCLNTQLNTISPGCLTINQQTWNNLTVEQKVELIITTLCTLQSQVTGCSAPTGLNIVTLNNGTTTLNWVATNTSTNWIVRYRVHGTTTWTIYTVTTPTNTSGPNWTVTLLSNIFASGTQYDFGVSAVCGSTASAETQATLTAPCGLVTIISAGFAGSPGNFRTVFTPATNNTGNYTVQVLSGATIIGTQTSNYPFSGNVTNNQTILFPPPGLLIVQVLAAQCGNQVVGQTTVQN